MAERDLLLKEKFDHTGIFDFGAFYSFAHSWFKDERYTVDEDKYSEKVSGNARDIIIEWTIVKRLSDYFKIEHKVRFIVEKLSDVEVEIDGVKKRMNKGKVEVEIKSNLVSDPDSKWDKTPFYRFIRDIYGKYIVPNRVDALRDKTSGDGRKFKEELKAYLELMGRR